MIPAELGYREGQYWALLGKATKYIEQPLSEHMARLVGLWATSCLRGLDLCTSLSVRTADESSTSPDVLWRSGSSGVRIEDKHPALVLPTFGLHELPI